MGGGLPSTTVDLAGPRWPHATGEGDGDWGIPWATLIKLWRRPAASPELVRGMPAAGCILYAGDPSNATHRNTREGGTFGNRTSRKKINSASEQTRTLLLFYQNGHTNVFNFTFNFGSLREKRGTQPKKRFVLSFPLEFF